MSLSDITVKVAEQPTGMASALLNELADSLRSLADSGTTDSIDLRSLPMNEADLAELAEMLGEGELDATVSSVGSSRIRETSYSGIWWITHYGDDGAVLAEFLEVTQAPQMLFSHEDDIHYALERIENKVQNLK